MVITQGNYDEVNQHNPTMEFRVKLGTATAKAPTKATDNSVGWDLYADEKTFIRAGERQLVYTNVQVDQLPYSTYGRIAPRSGLAFDHGIDVLAGVIDPDYRGNINVLLINYGRFDFEINVGDRIAQLILETYYISNKCMIVSEVSKTERGDGGFGSTGV